MAMAMEPSTMERREEQCLPPTQPYPWLIYFNGINNNQIFCSISDPTKTYSRSIPELGEAKLLTVQHGWFLLEKKGDVSELCLWKSSNEKINLPSLKHNGICDCIFSCSPTATEQVCSIFLFSSRGQSIPFQATLYYCQLGDKQWTEVDYREDLVRASAVEGLVLDTNFTDLCNPVYCNGRLYAESSVNQLLVVIEKLEPNRLEINSAHVFLPEHCWHGFECRSYLLESNHELYHIEISLQGDKIISIRVHKLDFSSRVWERVKSIKDKMFFLSDVDLPFACQAINPEIERGLIYFTSIQNKIVHKYNFEDNTLVICKPFSSLPEKCDRSFWFIPDIRMMTLALQEERAKTQIRGGGKSSAAIHSNETGDRATNSCEFPFEIIEVVAKYLNAIDYLHFRATNSFFRLKAPVLKCRSRSPISLSPLLVFFEKENVLTSVHPKHGNKYKYSINLPEDIQGDCEICYSKDGWLLLAVDGFSNMLYNPLTKEVKQLAYGPEETRNTPCVGLSHSPNSPECVVVDLGNISFHIEIQTTCLGKKVWETSITQHCGFRLYSNHPCFYKGAFYYLSDRGKLGILEVLGEKGNFWEECEKPDAPCTDYYKCFLVECNGRLLSVFEGAFGNWVRVFKLNASRRKWIEVKSLGDHMLFVGDQSFSAVAYIDGMENKIYFPRFYDENIVFYSLETNNYHTFESSKVVDFHCMKEKLNSSWI